MLLIAEVSSLPLGEPSINILSISISDLIYFIIEYMFFCAKESECKSFIIIMSGFSSLLILVSNTLPNETGRLFIIR